jgi:hypothetical protein
MSNFKLQLRFFLNFKNKKIINININIKENYYEGFQTFNFPLFLSPTINSCLSANQNKAVIVLIEIEMVVFFVTLLLIFQISRLLFVKYYFPKEIKLKK